MKNILRIVSVRISSFIGWIFSPLYKTNQKSKLFKELMYGQLVKYSLKKPRPSTLLAVKPITIVRGNHITMGENVLIGQHSVLSVWTSEGCISIADSVIIGSFAHITAINCIQIKKGALLGKYVTITDNSHGEVSDKELDTFPIKRKLVSKGAVVIGENVWIGDKVTILPNVTIGDYSIIGANSVITKSIPPYSVVCGNPARIIKNIVNNDNK